MGYFADYGKNLSVDLIVQEGFSYKQQIGTYFGEYRKHPVVGLFKELSDNDFDFGAPPAAMLHLANPPALELTCPFSEYIINRAGDEASLHELVAALRDFAAITDFMAFYNENQKYYEEIINNVKKKLPGRDYIGYIEKYYGMKKQSYTVILAPMLKGGFGVSPGDNTDVEHDYYIKGADAVIEDMPFFGDRFRFESVLLHEFSHPFVNPITAAHPELVEKYAHLFEKIRETMGDLCYTDWDMCVNEHIIRAFTSRYYYRESGTVEGEREFEGHREKGFIYLEAFCTALEEYENNREMYPDFKAYYPDLLEKVFGDSA